MGWLFKEQMNPSISSLRVLAYFWFSFVFCFPFVVLFFVFCFSIFSLHCFVFDLFWQPALHGLAHVFICFETFLLGLNHSSFSMVKFPGRFLILVLTMLNL